MKRLNSSFKSIDFSFIKSAVVSILMVVGVAMFLSACGDTNSENGGDGLPPELVELNKAIEKSPRDGMAYINRANYYLRCDSVNKALGDVNRAILTDSTNSVFFTTLSDVYLKMGNVPGAELSLNKASKLSPNSNDVLLKQARFYLVTKDYLKVDEKTRMAIELDKINPKAYFYRGWAAMEDGDTLSAIKNFDLSLSQDPDFIEPYILTAGIYASKHDPIALDYYRNALNVQPDNNDIRYEIATFFVNENNPEKAIEACNTIISNDSTFIKAYYMLGYIDLNFTGDYISGIKNFSKVLKYAPEYADAYYNRGLCNESVQDYKSARDDYNSYLKYNPGDDAGIKALNRVDKLDR